MSNSEEAAPAPLTKAVLTVFLPFSGGYFLSYLFRSVNAIIAPQLTGELGLGAADLGLLTAAYFLAFAAFQIPLGVLLDRFGPRKVHPLLLCFAALGGALFAFGTSLTELLVGRALIGLGVSGALMASFKAITMWFPRRTWPLTNGCFMAVGGLGAISATAPTEWLLEVTDWRGVFMGLAGGCVVIAALIFFVCPEREVAGRNTTLKESLTGIGHIFTDRLFWRVWPVSVAVIAYSMAVQGLWIGPYLRDVGAFGREMVANHLFWTAASLTVGFIFSGLVASRLERRGISLAVSFGFIAVAFMIAQGLIVFQIVPQSLLPWVLFALTGNATAINYALLSRHFPLAYAGRANTAINLMIFLGAFSIQYAIGGIISLWPTSADGGYAAEGYKVAFGVFLILQIITFAWFVLSARWAPASRS
ncbi:MFS transporter [Limibacillus halophilus]|uniref:MFS family permease n=1 Tax=Limibacillus halophilus TaxID=1579333 RepID=A0A839STU1_9PROT|nr:MFS transporter [Limibacillus halophilus]MBB3065130.1 MFS family permease [Limibacillus halophilus]